VAPIAADPPGERAGRRGAGELGDEERVRPGSPITEQPLACRLMASSPSCTPGVTPGTSSSTALTSSWARGRWSNVSIDSRPKGAANGARDRVQLTVGDVVYVKLARALQRRRARVGGEEDTVQER
jgi:hypothetical protein